MPGRAARTRRWPDEPRSQPAVTRASARAPTAGSARCWDRGSVTRWAIGVLAVATAALLLYLGALVVVGWLAVAALDRAQPSSSPAVDVAGMLADAAPALLVGWCIGRAAAAVLEPGRRCHRRLRARRRAARRGCRRGRPGPHRPPLTSCDLHTVLAAEGCETVCEPHEVPKQRPVRPGDLGGVERHRRQGPLVVLGRRPGAPGPHDPHGRPGIRRRQGRGEHAAVGRHPGQGQVGVVADAARAAPATCRTSRP